MDEWKDNRILEAIISNCDYNGLTEEIIAWKDKVKSKYDHICIRPNSQEEFIYMICVQLFGEYGCSPRTGWIEDLEGFHNFIDKFIEHYEEYKEYGCYDDDGE